MVNVAIIGGGWSGCAAAISAAKAGAKVTLLERTDMLLGTGLVGGIMRNNGRYTATEEAIAMGANELFNITDETSTHKDIDFPGHKHATLYNVGKIEPHVRKELEKHGIEILLKSRFTDVEMDGNKIVSVTTFDGKKVEADVFVDTTGTAGPQGNCAKYGNGCAMCALRCPSFGPRVSVTGKAGIEEFQGYKADGTIGAMSGSCKLMKESLSDDVLKTLNETGVAVVPIPEELRHEDVLGKKACQQYALKEFAENVILLDTGHAKLMTPFFDIDQLRLIPGFEEARFEDPYAGGKGNSMRYLAIAPRNNNLKVDGVDNLFCAGEKSGLMVGHTEAIVTGYLAGNNAVRTVLNKELLELPTSTAIGEAIAFVGEKMKTKEGRSLKYTFSGSVLFEHIKDLGMYTTDKEVIGKRVKDAGVYKVFDEKLV